MLNRRNRLGESGAIEGLAKMGLVFKTDDLLFRYANTGETPSRFAVNVSKKIDKRAVYRNRIRRQVSEAIRENLALMPNGYQVLVSARPSLSLKTPEFKRFNKAVLAFFNTLRSHAK